MPDDFGIKLSQTGRDIDSAGDAELIFNSSWPTVKVVFSGQFNALVPERVVLYEHNLGYTPAFMHYTIDRASDFRDGKFEIFREIVSADKKNIYWNPGAGGGPFTIKMGLVIYDIDLEKNFSAPVIKTGASSGLTASKDFGIKLTKEGKDTSSSRLEDYIIHSAARSPMVHSVTNVTPNDVGVGGQKRHTFTHDLPYNPVFMVYLQTATRGEEYALLNNFAGITTSENDITVLDVAPGKKATLVILKDPFTIDDNVQDIKA